MRGGGQRARKYRLRPRPVRDPVRRIPEARGRAAYHGPCYRKHAPRAREDVHRGAAAENRDRRRRVRNIGRVLCWPPRGTRRRHRHRSRRLVYPGLPSPSVHDSGWALAIVGTFGEVILGWRPGWAVASPVASEARLGPPGKANALQGKPTGSREHPFAHGRVSGRTGKPTGSREHPFAHGRVSGRTGKPTSSWKNR